MKNALMQLLFLLLVLLLMTGCVVTADGSYGKATVVTPPPASKPGPPPHAKAYGHRARYHYHYYPDVAVYFDIGRSAYFYLEDGACTMAVRLPSRLEVNLGSRVSIEMDSDRPYVRYEEHRKKYPGKKHKHKQKGKYKKKKKYDDD